MHDRLNLPGRLDMRDPSDGSVVQTPAMLSMRATRSASIGLLVAVLMSATAAFAAGTLTVNGTLAPQGSANYCVYSAMSDDGQGNWQVSCGGTGSKTITFTTPLVGQACTSYASLAEDSGGNWTVLNCVSSGTAANIYYVHTDNLGTPRLITRPSDDAVTWRWDNTEPFGLGSANETVSGTQFSYNLRFPGQYYDQETVTHYNYYRNYDASIGRYLESDRIGIRDGLNTYEYVHSRPVSLTDSTGRSAEGCCLKVQVPDNVLGYTICCDGKQVGCVNQKQLPNESSNGNARGVIEKCVLDHETEHYAHVPCPTCTVEPFQPNWKKGVSTSGGECMAYTRELRCLQTEKKTCDSDECRKGVQGRIDFVDRERQKRCGEAFQ